MTQSIFTFQSHVGYAIPLPNPMSVRRSSRTRVQGPKQYTMKLECLSQSGRILVVPPRSSSAFKSCSANDSDTPQLIDITSFQPHRLSRWCTWCVIKSQASASALPTPCRAILVSPQCICPHSIHEFQFQTRSTCAIGGTDRGRSLKEAHDWSAIMKHHVWQPRTA
jgi:hypothetical protein